MERVPYRSKMTLLVDIACPNCGRKRTVEKRGLGWYHCTNCGREFGQDEILPDASRRP